MNDYDEALKAFAKVKDNTRVREFFRQATRRVSWKARRIGKQYLKHLTRRT